MKRHNLVAALALLAPVGGYLQAQNSGPAAAAGAPAGPPPAAAKPVPAMVTPYHQRFRMVLARNGQEQEVGRLDDQVVVGEDHGKPAIIRVQNVDGPTGLMTDTAVADPGSLAPRWHSSHAERRTLRLEFEPKRVTGTYWEPGDPSIPVDQRIIDGLYDSNMMDVLISALPLADGYQGRLMVYLYEMGGATPVDIAVTGSAKVGETDTWVTGVTLGGRTARYFIGKTDRHVAQIVSSPQAGVEIRVVRDAP